MTVRAGADRLDNVWIVSLFAIFLAGGYVWLSVRRVRRWMQSLLRGPVLRALAGPTILLAAALSYASIEGLPVEPRAFSYAAYLFGPVVLLIFERRSGEPAPLLALAAATALWLPVEFDLLPSLPLPALDGYDASRLLAIVAAFYLFLVARPTSGIGYTFLLAPRDFILAGGAVTAYAVVALPLGFITGFLTWQPRVTPASLLVTPVVIYLIKAVPEEFLFRGLIQNLCSRKFGPRLGLTIASVIFGLAHLPDPRYVLLATLAGVAYGWVYARTAKITASAVTHTGVDWIWGLLLRR